MANRPIFLPVLKGSRLVEEVPINFVWHSGMAPSQKRKNVFEMHKAAALAGFEPLLEVSSKSDQKVGQRLSAFSLRIDIDEFTVATLESAYQGSKVFELGGPYLDLLKASSLDSKRDVRLKESGKLIGFQFRGRAYPLSPATGFYDWLYLNALYPHRKWMKRVQHCVGFTDIEFNPERSLNCQARSLATFIALDLRGLLDDAVKSFDRFADFLKRSSI